MFFNMYPFKNKQVKSIFRIKTILLIFNLLFTQSGWAIDFKCPQTLLSPAIRLNNTELSDSYLYLFEKSRQENTSIKVIIAFRQALRDLVYFTLNEKNISNFTRSDFWSRHDFNWIIGNYFKNNIDRSAKELKKILLRTIPSLQECVDDADSPDVIFMPTNYFPNKDSFKKMVKELFSYLLYMDPQHPVLEEKFEISKGQELTIKQIARYYIKSDSEKEAEFEMLSEKIRSNIPRQEALSYMKKFETRLKILKLFQSIDNFVFDDFVLKYKVRLNNDILSIPGKGIERMNELLEKGKQQIAQAIKDVQSGKALVFDLYKYLKHIYNPNTDISVEYEFCLLSYELLKHLNDREVAYFNRARKQLAGPIREYLSGREELAAQGRIEALNVMSSSENLLYLKFLVPKLIEQAAQYLADEKITDLHKIKKEIQDPEWYGLIKSKLLNREKQLYKEYISQELNRFKNLENKFAMEKLSKAKPGDILLILTAPQKSATDSEGYPSEFCGIKVAVMDKNNPLVNRNLSFSDEFFPASIISCDLQGEKPVVKVSVKLAQQKIIDDLIKADKPITIRVTSELPKANNDFSLTARYDDKQIGYISGTFDVESVPAHIMDSYNHSLFGEELLAMITQESRFGKIIFDVSAAYKKHGQDFAANKVVKGKITEVAITRTLYPSGFKVDLSGIKGFAYWRNIHNIDFKNLSIKELEEFIGKEFDMRIINLGIPGVKDAFIEIIDKSRKEKILKRNSTHKGIIIKIIQREDKIIGAVVNVEGVKCFAYRDKIRLPTEYLTLDQRLGDIVDVMILTPATQGKDPKVMIFDREAEKQELKITQKYITGTQEHEAFLKDKEPEVSSFGEQLKQQLEESTSNFSQPINLIHQAI